MGAEVIQFCIHMKMKGAMLFPTVLKNKVLTAHSKVTNNVRAVLGL